MYLNLKSYAIFLLCMELVKVLFSFTLSLKKWSNCKMVNNEININTHKHQHTPTETYMLVNEKNESEIYLYIYGSHTHICI